MKTNRLVGLVACVLLFSLCVPAQPAEKRAMTVDDGLDMIQVSGPEISPDGKWILFSRSELKWKDNKRASNFWMVAADGGEPFQFLSGENDSSPQWSPNGQTITFLRGRGEERQIHTIRANGGEAVKLTEHKDGISSFQWAHDGLRLFFLANDIKSEEEKKKEKDGDDALYVDEGPHGQTSRGRWNNFWVFDLAGKKERQITKEKMIIGRYEAAPDGRRIAFHARRDSIRNNQYLTEIYLADVESGAVTRLTENEAPESGLQWSPDGKVLAFEAADDKKWELANGKIWLLEVETRKARKVSGQFEGSIGEYAWTPDGRQMLFSAQQRTHRNLYRLDLQTGAVEQLTKKTGLFGAGSFSKDRSRVAATYSNPQTPQDIWSLDLKSGAERRLTDVNPGLRDRLMARTEVIQWKSTDGLEIEGILYLPSDYQAGKRIPLILVIHGGPAGSFTYGYSHLYHVYTGLGYALLSPNVRGSSGYTDALIRGNMHDLGGGDYRDLMTGVDAVIARGFADPDKLGVKGWSYGGILGGWTITQTDRFKAASLGAMVSDWSSEYAMGFNHDVRLWYIGGTPWENPEAYRRMSASTHIAKVKTPTIVIHGEQDTTDTIGQSMIYYQGLKDRGVPTRFIRFPREPHGFREPRHQRTRDVEEIAWMQKYINGVEWSSVRPEEGKKEEKKVTDN